MNEGPPQVQTMTDDEILREKAELRGRIVQDGDSNVAPADPADLDRFRILDEEERRRQQG
jgi:hypothetical protein